MARNVYAWPPVDAIATMWSISQPVNRSQSFFTGADISSSAERKRKIASVEVPGIGDLGGSMNGGYCEVLKELLEGGKNLVRLKSMPVNWYFDDVVVEAFQQSSAVQWQRLGVDVNWTSGGTETVWLSGASITGVSGTDGQWDIVTASGLPPNTLVARPGEYVTGNDAGDLFGVGSTSKVLKPAYSDASGVAVIYLMTALTQFDYLQLNSSETAVFMIDGDLPIGVQPVNGNWSYQWAFREVFSDEVGGFLEIDPWS